MKPHLQQELHLNLYKRTHPIITCFYQRRKGNITSGFICAQSKNAQTEYYVSRSRIKFNHWQWKNTSLLLMLISYRSLLTVVSYLP